MKTRVAQLPTTPGVYFWKSKTGKVLYIGKAKNLRARGRSYLSKDLSPKTAELMSHAADIEYISVSNEVEALLLENQLILKHKPPYNIMLKNSRRYAWICVTSEEFPRIISTRKKIGRGTLYGPYTDGSSRRSIVITLSKAFKLRTCKTLPKRACLQYHINNCTAPCEQKDDVKSYGERVEKAKKALAGHTQELIAELEKEMKTQAEQQRFEQAKELRDQITALKNVRSMQVVERDTTYDQDVIGHMRVDEEIQFCVLRVRRGVISKKQEYRVQYEDTGVESFLKALYRESTPPGEIIIEELTEKYALEKFLSKQANGTVTITHPKRGDKRKLLDLANTNAEQAIAEENAALGQLKKHLRLAEPPQVIDCFDISTHQGSHTVASSVRYRNGRADPEGYRRYTVRGEQQNDFAAMQEVVRRRYASEPLPDLVVIDGGKGQLSAAVQSVPRGTPIIGLAKRDEEVFVPGRKAPLSIPQKDPGLLLLRRIRDAAHRFAVSYHRSKKGRAMTESALDHIQGIGPTRKQALYNHFKTFSRIKQASQAELGEVLGPKTGKHLFDALHKDT